MSSQDPTARRRHARAATTAVVVALVGGLAAAPVAPTGAAPVVPAPAACADPIDCRLHEAGDVPGVHVGMLVQVGDADEAAIGATELDSVINHGISWNVVEPTRGTEDWSRPDAVADYARAHGLRQIGMHLFWDQEGLDDLPGWVLGITDPTELRAVLRERARAVLERYPDLARLDVLNEPIEAYGGQPYDNHFRRVLGPGYAAELFAIAAAEAPPGVELFLNENLVEYLPEKADALVALVEQLVAAGAPIDAVGLQSHLIPGEPDWDLYLRTMQRLEALGVTPFITELDVPVPATVPDRAAVQAERYRRAAEVCLSVATCDELIVWGVSDRSSWLDWFLAPGLAPLLLDQDLQPKPAYAAVRDELLAGRQVASEPPVPTTAPPATAPPAPAMAPAAPVATRPSFTG